MTKKNKIPMFYRDESGNVAMMAAITFGALAIMLGAAVEYTSLTNRSQDLQNATDSAVLAAARSGETDLKKLQEIATYVFNQNYTFQESESLVEFVASVSDDDVLSLKARLKKPNLFSGSVGDKDGYVTVEAASLLSSEMGLDVALVLDRTGSMAGTKMAGLKSATSQFIQDIQSNDGDVRLSVVPFSDYVNVGVSTTGRSWLDLPVMNLSGSEVECTMENVSTSACQSAPSGTSSGSGGTGGTSSGGSGSCSATTSSSSGGSASASSSSSSSGGTCTATASSSSGATTTPWSMTWTDIYYASNGAYCTNNTDPAEDSGDLVEECIPVEPAENWLGCVGSRTAPYNNGAGEHSPLKPPLKVTMRVIVKSW